MAEYIAIVDPLERHREAIRGRLLRSGTVRAGPGSVFWKVHREWIVAAGWGRAILLQLAHPAVAAGVRDHSSFRGSLRASLGRARSTVSAMLAISFGDEEEMIGAAARINAIHDRVRGTTYSAHDPQLQRWVHATLLQSTLLSYTRLVGPLPPRERDRYCAEAAIMEPLLGIPSGLLPRDVAQLDAYMQEMLAGGHLVVTDTSRALARAMLYPSRSFLCWPAFRALQLLTVGTLPSSIRQDYGFAWRAGDARAFARWVALLRTGRRLLPPIAREWQAARGSRRRGPRLRRLRAVG